MTAPTSRAWQAALAYLCEEKNLPPGKIVLDAAQHTFLPTVSGGSIWIYTTADLQYGGTEAMTTLLSPEQARTFDEMLSVQDPDA